MITDRYNTPSIQGGSALIISLMLVIVVSLLSLSGIQSAILETRMASNLQDSQKAMQSADSAVRHGWELIGQSGYDVDNFVTNTSSAGLYDLRGANLDTSDGNKLIAEWTAIRSARDWPWDDDTKRYAMPDSLDQDGTTNPMEIAAPPQFVIGMHDIIKRKGSESFYCISYSVIGAGRGTNSVSRKLVELKVIPKGGCFMNIVN
ncbi:MAG: hypothetical protein GY896_06365 [Gammaproteobacteria bacterium]|nr:hypothetical protein [Gammaproteobacteria bacterium]